MEFIGLRIEVHEEVVVVARVAVPKSEQSLHRPIGVEGIKVDQFTDGALHVLSLAFEDVDEPVNLLSSRHLFSPLELETPEPSFVEINVRSFVQRTSVIAVCALKQWIAHGFHVRIDTEVHPIDRHFGIGAAWSGGTGGIEQGISHELAHQAMILLVVVQRQVGKPFDTRLLVNVIEFDF